MVGVAALSGAHETPASPPPAAMLDSSRDLVALHRFADPSPFRCTLCRLAPQLKSPAAVTINNHPRNCDAVPASMSHL